MFLTEDILRGGQGWGVLGRRGLLLRMLLNALMNISLPLARLEASLVVQLLP